MLNPKNKERIESVVIVEGKTDTNRLKTLFNVDTIETNGSALSEQKINQIIHVAESRGVILFLDPDGPGENIRKKLQSRVDNFKQAFIKKTDIPTGSKKIGVAEATDEAIRKALENAISFDSKKESISWPMYISFQLDSRLKRNSITNYLKISECNHKQLFHRLNMMGIDEKKLKEIIDNGKE